MNTQSFRLWNLDLCQDMPKQISSTGIVAVRGDITRIGTFLRENFPNFAEESQGVISSERIKRSKQIYLCGESDLIELQLDNKTIGIFVGAAEDWSSYYVRMFAIMPQYQTAHMIRRFIRECLFTPMTEAGVERISADTSPVNVAMTHLFGELKFYLTGSSLSDRWGPLARYTKFLNQANEEVFLRRFGVGGIIAA